MFGSIYKSINVVAKIVRESCRKIYIIIYSPNVLIATALNIFLLESISSFGIEFEVSCNKRNN